MNNNASDNNVNNALNNQTQAQQPAPANEQTNSAKEAIKAYLDARAASDPQFATVYAKPKKNIDECFRYILGEARKRGNSVCMTDDEVFGLAVHYYDEDDIKVSSSPANFRASTNRKPAPAVELTEEEKVAAREAAIKRYEDLCVAEEAERAAKRKKAEVERKKAEAEQKKQQVLASSPSLFDFDEI